jgi:hypothetical protein
MRQAVIGVLFLVIFAGSAAAQDDVSTQNASSATGGAWITGPASNPLSFLNGPAYRTFGSTSPYDFPDFNPATLLNQRPHDGSASRRKNVFGTRVITIWVSKRPTTMPTP